MRQFLEQLATDDSGQDLIEFAMASALIGLLAMAATKGLSNSIGTTFNGVGTPLANS